MVLLLMPVEDDQRHLPKWQVSRFRNDVTMLRLALRLFRTM
jgi:hypothetical protein